MSSTRSTASAGRSTSARRRSRPASRRSSDTAHVENARQHNEKWLAWLTDEIRKLGLKVTPSVGNFMLIHFPETKGKTAKDADALLTSRGAVLRAVGAYDLPNALRMTIGTEEANRLVVATLAELMGKKG